MKRLSCKTTVFLIVMLLSGCLPNMQISQTPAIATATSRPFSVTPTTNIPSTQPAAQCFGVQTELPAVEGNFVLSGDYWLSPDSSGNELHRSPSYILKPNAGIKILLPNYTGEEIVSFSISPNRKFFAYHTNQTLIDGTIAENGRWLIVDNNGQKLKEYLKRLDNWRGIVEWPNDDQLLISKFAGQDAPYPTIILNPFSGKEEEIAPNYPEIYSIGNPLLLWSWEEYAHVETAYNSDLSLVVYLKSSLQKIALLDIKSGKTIKEIDIPGMSSGPPLWLSDGTKFIIDIPVSKSNTYPSNEELMSVNTNGEIKQLTHLLDLFNHVEIGRYSESADERYVAFWFRHAENVNSLSDSRYQLAVYDTVTEQTKIYCVETHQDIHAPIWSPTKHQLLVAGFLDSSENYGTIWVDVDTGTLSYIEKDVIPIGWMLDNQ